MIIYINTRLLHWAQWCVRRDDGGLGFPRQSPYTRLQGRSDGNYHVDMDSEAWEIEQAVQYIKQHQPMLYDVVAVYYRRTMTVQQMCSKCQCGERTFYYRLHQAHVAVMEWMGEQFIKSA